jgi:putative intracellular protease/amidase
MSALEKTPAPTPDSPATNALMIIFPGFNTIDMNGPYEILRDAKFEIRGDAIGVTVASETEITTATEGTIVKVYPPLNRIGLVVVSPN